MAFSVKPFVEHAWEDFERKFTGQRCARRGNPSRRNDFTFRQVRSSQTMAAGRCLELGLKVCEARLIAGDVSRTSC